MKHIPLWFPISSPFVPLLENKHLVTCFPITGFPSKEEDSAIQVQHLSHSLLLYFDTRGNPHPFAIFVITRPGVICIGREAIISNAMLMVQKTENIFLSKKGLTLLNLQHCSALRSLVSCVTLPPPMITTSPPLPRNKLPIFTTTSIRIPFKNSFFYHRY